MTIVTHGFELFDSLLPATWVDTLADSIADKAGSHTAVYKMVVSERIPNVYVSEFSYERGDRPGLSTNPNSEVVIKLHWEAVAGTTYNPVTYSTSEIAAAVAPLLYQPAAAEGLVRPLAEMPFHLIGHSRGGSLMCELALLLGREGIWVDQVTTLDPRPVIWRFVQDGPALTYENVLFADNYYQDIPFPPTFPNGQPVDGAYNRHLNDYLAGGYGDGPIPPWDNHFDVHLWYHGTVDTQLVSDGDGGDFTPEMRTSWYYSTESQGGRAGYYYTRLGTGDRTSSVQPAGPTDYAIDSGYNLLALTGQPASNRTSLPGDSPREWPNVPAFTQTPDTPLKPGDSFQVGYLYQDFNSQCQIKLILDKDQNPYNNGTAPYEVYSATQPFTASTLPRPIVNCTVPPSIPLGQYHLLAKITDSTDSRHTRYLYAPGVITIVSSGGGGDDLPAPTLYSPADHATNQAFSPAFSWSAISGATSYRLIVTANASDLPRDPTVGTCPSAVLNTTPTSPSYSSPGLVLNANTTYYWEVHARSPSQFGDWSTIGSFTTAPVVNWIGGNSGDWDNPFNWSTGVIPTGTDNVVINGGIVNLSHNEPFASLVLQSGTLNWSGGDIYGAVTIGSGSVLNITGSATRGLYANLSNAGTINYSGTGGLLTGYGITLNNLAGGIFDFKSDGWLSWYYSGEPNVINAGTFRKSGGTGTSYLDMPFTNTGTVVVKRGIFQFSGVFNNNGLAQVQAGTLQLASGSSVSSGTFSVSLGATLGFTGSVVAGASFTGAGATLLMGTVNGTLVGTNFQLNSGSVTGAFVLAGTLNWSGGDISGAVTIGSGSVLNINNGTQKGLYANLSNSGTINYDATDGVLSGFGVTFNNLSDGVFDFKADAGLSWYYSTQPTVINAGTFRKSVGSGTSYLDMPFTNTGTVLVQSGTLLFANLFNNNGFAQAQAGTLFINGGGISSGTFDVALGATLNFSGTLAAGATFTGAGPTTLIGGINGTLVGSNFQLNTGSVSGTFALAGTLNWSGGDVYGTITVGTGSVLNINSGAQKGLYANLSNSGTINCNAADGVLTGYGVTFNNLASGVFDFKADGWLSWYYSTQPNVINSGTFRKSGGSGTSSLDMPFTNTGSVVVQSGILLFYDLFNNNGLAQVQAGTLELLSGNSVSDGIFDVALGATLNFSGTLAPGATFTGAGSTTLAGAINGTLVGTNFQLNSGSVSGTFVLAGTLAWSGGDIYGTVTIDSGSVLNITGGATRGLYANLSNAGTINYSGTGGLLTGYGITFNNLAGGVFDFQSDGWLSWYYSGEPSVINAGTLRKSGGTGTSYLDMPFNNTGTVTVQSGTLLFYDVFNNNGLAQVQAGMLQLLSANSVSSGIFDVSLGATLQFSGTLATGATFTGAGATLLGGTVNGTLVGTNFQLNSGSVSGTFVLAGTLAWSGGDIYGTVTIDSGSVLNITGGATRGLYANLSNAGTINYSGTGGLLTGYGITFNNLAGGVFDFQSDGWLSWYYSGEPSVINAGTLRKSGGTGTSYLDMPFTNTGAVTVQGGTLAFYGLYSQTDGATLLQGGTLTSVGIMTLNGGSISGSGIVNASIDNGAHVAPGFPSIGQLTINGNYTQLPSGTVDLEINGSQASQSDRLTVTGNVVLDGALNVDFIDSYLPGLGTSFSPIKLNPRATLSGDFATQGGSPIGNGLYLESVLKRTGLTLSVLGSYDQWKVDFFGDDAGNPDIAGDNANPSGDGIPNLLKYAFDVSPLIPSTFGLPAYSVETSIDDGKQRLLLTYRHRLNSSAELTYTVLVSDDLATWDSSGVQIETVGPPIPTGDGISELITVRLTAPIDGTIPRKFLDLQVDRE